MVLSNCQPMLQISSKSILHKPCKLGPQSGNDNIGHFDLTQLELNFIAIIQMHKQLLYFWYKLNKETSICLNKILGVNFIFYREFILSLNFLKKYNDSYIVNAKAFESWSVLHNLNLRLQKYKIRIPDTSKRETQ